MTSCNARHCWYATPLQAQPAMRANSYVAHVVNRLKGAAGQHQPGAEEDWAVVVGMSAAGVSFLTEEGATLAHLAAGCGNLEALRDLAAAGVDMAAASTGGTNPLHIVAQHWDDPELARALLEAGADPGAEDDYGWTPLRLAEKGGHVKVVALLREAGAK